MSDAVVPQYATDRLKHYERMRVKGAYRDNTHNLLHQVRQGHIRQLFPDELEFSLSFDGSPIANFVDIVARDMAEGIAPLPALACVSGKMQSDADLERAEKKNKVGQNYWNESKLEIQMLRAADRYVTYGFLPGIIEPATDRHLPYIHLVDPRRCYYELNRYGDVSCFARVIEKTVDDLCATFPEYASIIRRPDQFGEKPSGDALMQVVQFIDKTDVSLLLPEREGLVLASYAHKMSKPPVAIAERPGESDDPRGQFDDVIWVQVARSVMSTFALEAASIAVQAPIAVPSDMDEFAVGPHAILQSDQADKIRKVNLELPPQIFAENQVLDQELKLGARYPDARTGGIQGASVITGKGVEALLGTFDAQIKGAQTIFKQFLQTLTSMCFEMDEAWWPNVSKTVTGTLSGTSYEFSYTPKKDINGRTSCTVTYGFAAGMQPSQSIITLLQLEGAGLIARSTTQENLPFSIDAIQEQRKINIEGWREALKQGLFAYIQASGQIASQGGDPTDLFNLTVDVIHRLQDGQTEEDAVAAAYTAQQQQKQAEQQAAQDAAQAAQSVAGPDGGLSVNGSNGLPAGVAPGQAGLPPGGLPTIARLVAGFRGNGSLPVNEATVQRRIPTGT